MSVFCAADLFMFSTGMGCLLSTRIRRRLPPGVRHVVDAYRGSGETQRGDRSDGQDLQRPASHHRLAVYAAGKNETRHQLSTNQRRFRKCSCKLPVTVTCWWICVDGEQFTAAIMTVICAFCGRSEWNCENLQCLLKSSREVL